MTQTYPRMKELENVDEPLWYASLVYFLNSVESKFSFPNFFKVIKYKENELEYCRTSIRWTITGNIKKFNSFSINQCFEKEVIKHDERK